MNDVARTDTFMASLGRETYRVGGSVRDQLLSRRIKDADYMVRGAALNELRNDLEKGLKGRTKPFVSPLKDRSGRQMGWRAGARGLGAIEITLPRREVSTGPGHRDFDIVLDPALPVHEDCKRRDFTFNALYFRVPDGPVTDPTACGLYDLQHKLIRTTHADSFRDDPLRTLRALRFVSTLGYDLTQDTREQMERHADAVTGLTGKGVSGTVLDELCKLLMGEDPAKALRLARDTGVLATLLPELAPMLGFEQESRYHDLTTDEHVFTAIETAGHVDAPLRVRLALLFHDSGKPRTAWKGTDGRVHYYANKSDPDATADQRRDHEDVGAEIAEDALRRLNAPKQLRDDVVRLVRNHMVAVSGRVKGSKIRRERVVFGDAFLSDLYLHRMCDITGKGRPNQNHLAHLAACERERAAAQESGAPRSLKDLQIGGRDLAELGIPGGPEMGRVLAAVLDEVVVDPSGQKLTREWQLDRAAALK
jgi:tRNA nucleotidyltransferase/poly(A) polymerase